MDVVRSGGGVDLFPSSAHMARFRSPSDAFPVASRGAGASFSSPPGGARISYDSRKDGCKRARKTVRPRFIN